MIDLKKPIEAVHKDGRVVPMKFNYIDENGDFFTNSAPCVDTSNNAWHSDGSDCCRHKEWTIRNVAEPEQLFDPDDWAIEVALKRLSWSNCTVAGVREYGFKTILEVARMIQKYEPHLKPKPPVDPDVLAVREILAAFHTNIGEHAAARNYRDGDCDNGTYFLAAVEAFKRVKGGVL